MTSIPQVSLNPPSDEQLSEGALIFKEDYLQDFSNLVEIVETGLRGANVLLRNGYRLLHVDLTAKPKARRVEGKVLAYVHKDIVYVLGRNQLVNRYTLTDKDFQKG